MDIPGIVSRETIIKSLGKTVEKEWRMPAYTIQVFNRRSLQPLPGQDLTDALQAVHFKSLCRQYGLDSSLIQSMLTQLEVISPAEGTVPYFLLKYRAENQPALVVFQYSTDQEAGTAWLQAVLQHAVRPQVRAHLAQTREMMGISLTEDQLEDLGLLLAYEVARWAAFWGQGLVYGLDGLWYRLNRHQAFIPVENEAQS